MAFLVASIIASIVEQFCPITLVFVDMSLRLVIFLVGFLRLEIELEEELKELLYIIDPVFGLKKLIVFL